MAAAPSRMNTVRSTSAIATPTSSTFCWNSLGTANFVMMMRKTNRLSTERLFSVMYPAKYSVPKFHPPHAVPTTTPKSSASTT